MLLNEEPYSTKRKALRINLDADIFGTLAEIGGGQEVARAFFQAGGASGTVAKSISAYDKNFSDSFYKKVSVLVELFSTILFLYSVYEYNQKNQCFGYRLEQGPL